MCFHERVWLDECPVNFKPVFYRRYVDDTFLLFKDKTHVPLFLDYLNSKHPNIKFTSEIETNSTLPFLDININRSNNSFNTSVYRKPSSTSLGLSFFSFCSHQFKTNAISTLIYRAYNICSNYNHLHTEFQFLIGFFKSNGFPTGIVNSHIKRFLAARYKVAPFNSDPIDPIFYISLPFFGPYSDKLKSEFLKVLGKYFNDVSFKIVLSNKLTIGSFFKYKDSLPLMSRASVIYRYTCPQCGAEYVGVTSRALFIRIAEHRGVSFRTNRPLSHPPHSSIRSHREQSCCGPIKPDDFNIVDCHSDFVSLRILESLHIFKSNPSLNESLSSFPLCIVK